MFPFPLYYGTQFSESIAINIMLLSAAILAIREKEREKKRVTESRRCIADVNL